MLMHVTVSTRIATTRESIVCLRGTRDDLRRELSTFFLYSKDGLFSSCCSCSSRPGANTVTWLGQLVCSQCLSVFGSNDSNRMEEGREVGIEAKGQTTGFSHFEQLL